MKNKHIISLYIFLAGLCFSTTSCEDMLTPDMERYSLGFSGKDTVNAYFGICKDLQEVVEQHLLLGELRGDLVESTPYTSDSINAILNLDRLVNGDNALLNRAAYYKVINECNHYLARVDTMAKKNNIYYMRKEAAQVELIRAWTYMQLVQVYGSVPFITAPITSANSGLDKTAPVATSDNLLDLLLQSGLDRAARYEKLYGFPNYGKFDNGAVDIDHAITLFPSDVILGDLYLLRGASVADYEKAASYYYEYLENYQESTSYHLSGERQAYFSHSQANGKDTYISQPLDWINAISVNDEIKRGMELTTVIPAASNSAYGMMLTRIPNIYGFDIHSYNAMDGDDSNGAVSIRANYKVRQVQPSVKFEKLAKSQQYFRYDATTKTLDYPENVGDARLDGSAPLVRSEEGDGRFIQKFGAAEYMSNGVASASSFRYRYCVPVYRYTQILLRYAEAINRAGFPRHAYAALNTCIGGGAIPELFDSLVYAADSLSATRVYYVDSTEVVNTLNFLGDGADEIRRAEGKSYLQYGSAWWSNVGVHTLGCGAYSEKDTVRVYEKVVAQRVADELARTGKVIENTFVPGLDVTDRDVNEQGDSIDVFVKAPAVPSDAEINAVETLIADEMALETAFEGFRYYDLMRLARHKDYLVGASYGTEWFAWTIARRGVDAAPYEQVNEKDNSLYDFLLSPVNWFLPNP